CTPEVVTPTAYVSCRCVWKARPANQALNSSTPPAARTLAIQPSAVSWHDRSRPTPDDLICWWHIAHPWEARKGSSDSRRRNMSVEQIVAFLVFALVAAITPGPSNIMLTAAGARVGVLRGFPCLLGATTGMGLMLFVVPLGLGSVALDHPLVLKGLKAG